MRARTQGPPEGARLDRAATERPSRPLCLARQARFLVALIFGLATLLPVRLAELLIRGSSPSRVTSLFHRVLIRGLRIEIELDGELARDALLVANHVSWTDILVLGGSVPTSFVAKAEVRRWPLLGLLARLNPTLFVRRDARTAVPAQVAEIASALARGRVALFPEGTTGDGSDVLPFRPALFAAAAGRRIQPVAILYRPAGRAWRPGELGGFAWDGDKEFWPHLLAIAGGRPTRCRVMALPPIHAGQYDRKALAILCRSLIRERLETPSERQAGT